MKTLFIEAYRKDNTNIDSLNFSVLPDKIFLAYSIQYRPLALRFKKKLGKRIVGFQQVLGCTRLKSKEPILLIGSGRFHALNLALQGNIVYILEAGKIRKLDNEEIEKFKKQKKAAKIRFFTAEKIGIIVSCKPGQENIEKALDLRKKLEEKGKKVSIFVEDTVNFEEFENYPVDSWVNTACKALEFDYPVLNLEDIEI